MGLSEIITESRLGSIAQSQAKIAKAVRHRREFDDIVIYLLSGIELRIPRCLIPELADASIESLEHGLTLCDEGKTIRLKQPEVQILVATLLLDLLGISD